MIVQVKNRTAHAILLRDAKGDTIQINGNTIKEIDDSFLIDYDTLALQIIQPKTVTIITAAPIDEAKKPKPKPKNETKVQDDETTNTNL